MDINTSTNNIYDTVVIGAGIAGVVSALNISKSNNILMLEKCKEILPPSSSTYGSAYKIHIGTHYIRDLETAKKCILKGIQFIREFPSFYNIKDQFYKSRLYLMSNSAISENDALYNFNQLKEYYKVLVNQDPSNKVLGEPDDLIKVLPKSHYEKYISNSIQFQNKDGVFEYLNVSFCIEYIELILDFDKFKTYIINQIKLSNNIKVEYDNNISNIKKLDSSCYAVSSNKDTFICKSIINCSFESIESLDKQVFEFNNDDDLWTRLKVSIVIDVPESMKGWFTSSLFAIGPYCSFTVISSNRVVVISERYFNLGHFKSSEPIPTHMEEIIGKLNLNNEFGRNLAYSGLKDASQYFNEPYKSDILNSKVIEIKRGFIKVHEKNFNSKSMYNSNSGVHKRDDELFFRANNYVSNCSTKMTYAIYDSKLSTQYINKYLKLTKESL